MISLLTPHQNAVADRYLAAQSALRAHLVVSLSGAHAYGFPSPDSDLDLKAIHIAPTAELLGLGHEAKPVEHLEIVEGVEVDYSSNELQHVLKSLLGGNGNYAERILGHLQPVVSEDLASLRPLAQACLSNKLYRHYNGFARQLYGEWQKTGFTSAKKLLYVVRTTMTGLHVLTTGRIETDVTQLIEPYGLQGVPELVDQKRRGEKAELPPTLATEWQQRVEGYFARLDAALERSVVPPEPPVTAVQALDAWLIALRLRRV